VYHSKDHLNARGIYLRDGIHTDILATRWSRVSVIRASFDAIVQGEAVVVSTKYRASRLLDGIDGGFGRTRRRYVYWYFEVFCTLEAASSALKKRVIARLEGVAHRPVA
jgi:hypothetical protein